eukprot:2619480-Rhodomonas_salina.1
MCIRDRMCGTDALWLYAAGSSNKSTAMAQAVLLQDGSTKGSTDSSTATALAVLTQAMLVRRRHYKAFAMYLLGRAK